MKLSLTLSTLLLGSTLMFTGCGSDSDTTPTGTDTTEQSGTTDTTEQSGTTDTTEQVAKLSASMLAGKTLSVYGYQNGGVAGDGFMSLIISADASTGDAVSLDDATEVYVDDAVLSITEDSLSLSFNGNLVSYSLISIDDNGLYFAESANTMGNGIGAYPVIMAYETQADKGAALLNSLASATDVTKEKLSATPRYTVDFGEGWAECWAIETFKTDGTFSGKGISGGLETYSANYSLSENVMTYITSDGNFTSEVLSITDDLMILQYTSTSNDSESDIGGETTTTTTTELAGTRAYTSKQDAIDFAMSHGQDCSSYYEQLEQP